MTQLQNLKKAIEYLEEAMDTFPDKDDSIRDYNDELESLITKVKDLSKKDWEKDYPRITIEGYGLDDDGHISFIDIHDEKFGSAIFFQEGSEHRHGFNNNGVYNKKKWL